MNLQPFRRWAYLMLHGKPVRMKIAPPNADRELVEAVLRNAPGAFETLVRTHQGLCWHIIYRMVRHPEDARELCQETFLRVHQKLHQYRYESALKSWIGQIAYSIALRHLERKKISLVEAHPDLPQTDPLERVGDDFDLEGACADEQTTRLLHQAIESLPPLPRMLLTLYHLQELTIPEITQILAGGTIKSHLFRSRLKLRQLLEPTIGVFP
jgi:RNA polymerase sigma factor (sigma-70 family)